MASVFVVRSRRPLLHYYSYPARPGVPQDGEQPWRDPLNQTDLRTLRARGGKLGPSTRAVCTLEVLPSTSRERRGTTRGEGGPYFFPRAHVNQSGTISRPSNAEERTSATMRTTMLKKNVCRRNRLFVRELYIDDSCVRDASKTKTKRACDQFFFFSLSQCMISLRRRK